MMTENEKWRNSSDENQEGANGYNRNYSRENRFDSYNSYNRLTSMTVDGVIYASISSGSINCLSGFGAGIGIALQNMPIISTTTTVLANSMNVSWSLVTESACDILGILSNLTPLYLNHFRKVII